MKILVTIASYGAGNDPYLERMIAEYRSMAHAVDIVILSNIPKPMPPGVEVVVGLPTSDPWSLPFAHKRVLADRVDRYDLFIYSENDILITIKNIDAFLWATTLLPENEIAGFLRTEVGPDGRRYYPDVNKMYHWDPQSVEKRGDHIFSCFTCEHAGCYILTRPQLQRAIDSGGFLVEPHDGKYDLACTAATDPYTQCGFKKMICISALDQFLVPHLSNKYVGTDYDLEECDFEPQIEALMEINQGKRSRAQLLKTETSLPLQKLSKSYYEAPRREILELIPAEVRTLLSIGCGWGAMEQSLIQKGIQVAGVPLDSVISACAEARGVRMVAPDFETAWKELGDEQFDCVLLSNILHLVPHPSAILSECGRRLLDGGHIIVIAPNFNYLKLVWRRICTPGYVGRGDPALNLTTRRRLQQWLRGSGLAIRQVVEVIPKRAHAASRLLNAVAPYLASDIIVAGGKPTSSHITLAGHISKSQKEPDQRLTVPVS
jgi:2-polyprenyl-3-methyl-5-hydroxy-6-metoxy-1,4-benzoquinol methylase